MKACSTGSQRERLYFVPLKGSFIIRCTAEEKISACLHTRYYLLLPLLLFLLRNDAEKENYVTSVIPIICICKRPQIRLAETGCL